MASRKWSRASGPSIPPRSSGRFRFEDSPFASPGGDDHPRGREPLVREDTMRAFRRILHPTDFSSASRPALARAIGLARQNRAGLVIVHALAPLILPLGDGFVSSGTYDALDRRAHEQARTQLARLVARIRKRGVRATALLVDGVPHEQIPRIARRRRADLIVIGT